MFFWGSRKEDRILRYWVKCGGNATTSGFGEQKKEMKYGLRFFTGSAFNLQINEINKCSFYHDDHCHHIPFLLRCRRGGPVLPAVTPAAPPFRRVWCFHCTHGAAESPVSTLLSLCRDQKPQHRRGSLHIPVAPGTRLLQRAELLPPQAP